MIELLNKTENLVSGAIPFAIIVVFGAYLTIKTRFFQFRLLGKALFGVFKPDKKNSNNSISSFQSACTCLSATIGTGNIAGVAAALTVGGPGSVFWMWIAAILGTVIKVSEILLSLKYRQTMNGSHNGGPMYYMVNGIGKWFSSFAFIYAVIGLVTSFFSGNLVQTTTACATVEFSMILKVGIGLIFMFITLFVLIGGVQKIGKFSEIVVPVMAAVYIILCFGIIFKNFSLIPEVLRKIIIGAFHPSAVTGGAIGTATTALAVGSERGVFSNEAGLGTAALAHSESSGESPIKESLYGIFEVFVDTILICSLTAITILSSGIDINYGTIVASLVNDTFRSVYGDFASFLIVLMTNVFAVTSIVGWGLYGIQITKYLFHNKGKTYFILLYAFTCFIGSFVSAAFAWRVTAFLNGLLVFINVFALFFLKKEIIYSLKRCTKFDTMN